MNNSKKRAIGLFLWIIVFCAICIYFQNKSYTREIAYFPPPVEEVSPSTPPVRPVSSSTISEQDIKTDNWQTYANTSLGFQLQYPPTYHLYDKPHNLCGGSCETILLSIDEGFPDTDKGPGPTSLVFGTSTEQLEQTNISNTEKNPDLKILYAGPAKIGNLNVLKIEYSIVDCEECNFGTYDDIWITKGSEVYWMSYFKDNPYFEKIASTFEFIQ